MRDSRLSPFIVGLTVGSIDLAKSCTAAIWRHVLLLAFISLQTVASDLVFATTVGHSSCSSVFSGTQPLVAGKLISGKVAWAVRRLKAIPVRRAQLWDSRSTKGWAAMPQAFGARNLFYPFAGADVLTPVRLMPDVNRIVAVQLFPFGDIVSALVNLRPTSRDEIEDHLVNQTMGMLSSGRTLDVNDLGRGMGLMALLEIEFLLAAEIVDIHYIERQGGRWVERSLGEARIGFPEHGRIRFLYQGRLIDYYLLRADLADHLPVLESEQRNFGQSYLDHQEKAKHTGVSPTDAVQLLEGQSYVSFLKAIHQGKGRLATHFSQLHQLLLQSRLILSEDDPFEPFVRLHRQSRSQGVLFGEGPLQIWQNPNLPGESAQILFPDTAGVLTPSVDL